MKIHETRPSHLADAIRAGTGSIICSSDHTNQTYVCENGHLLQTILRHELCLGYGQRLICHPLYRT